MELQKRLQELFMLKIREAMSSSKNNPMDGIVNVDEFVLGGSPRVQL